MKRNYQKELDALIADLQIQNRRPSLLIHSCCAPCSSYVLEYLSQFFDITIYYYNPNISPESEYIRRLEEQSRLIRQLQPEQALQHTSQHKIRLISGSYDHGLFLSVSKGLEGEPEGGRRCEQCFRLRLEAAAKKAKELGFDYFTTTLSISPHKDAQLLNQIGEEMAFQYSVPYLASDFKKKNGYKRSIELSALYDLYRQDYCGCAFSKRDRMQKNEIL